MSVLNICHVISSVRRQARGVRDALKHRGRAGRLHRRGSARLGSGCYDVSRPPRLSGPLSFLLVIRLKLTKRINVLLYVFNYNESVAMIVCVA